MTCEMLRTIQVTMTLHGGKAGGYISLWKYSGIGPPRDIPDALQYQCLPPICLFVRALRLCNKFISSN